MSTVSIRATHPSTVRRGLPFRTARRRRRRASCAETSPVPSIRGTAAVPPTMSRVLVAMVAGHHSVGMPPSSSVAGPPSEPGRARFGPRVAVVGNGGGVDGGVELPVPRRNSVLT